MKLLTSLVLALILAGTLVIPSAAVSSITPPSWVKEAEYVILDGDPVYSGEAWQQILRFREDAAAGHKEPKNDSPLGAQWSIWEKQPGNTSYSPRKFSVGEWFERGLVAMEYAANSDTKRNTATANRCFVEALKALKDSGADTTATRQLIQLWGIRAGLLKYAPDGTEKPYSAYLDAVDAFISLRKSRPIKLAEVLDSPLMDPLTDTTRARISRDITEIASRISIQVNGTILKVDRGVADGRETYRDVDPVIVNGRTMVPIRMIAEALGADVEWVPSIHGARLTRAGVQIDLPIGKTVGYKNGQAFQMEVAPYVKSGRTMVPARYVAEFFDQTVNFDTATRTVVIAEDKSVAGESNLESWLLPMGAMLNKLNGSQNLHEPGSVSNAMRAKDTARKKLSQDTWDIHSRDELIQIIYAMTYHGHNDSFLEDAALIRSWTPSQYQEVLNNAQGIDAYMFPYTKQLSEKWGDRGILCWDLFRMSNLAQWGYQAGYLTYSEMLAMVEPAATLLHDNFKSWDEAYENYLDGYNWWARNDVLGKDVWKTSRGETYKRMKADNETADLFDDSLFHTPVRGISGVTATGLLATASK